MKRSTEATDRFFYFLDHWNDPVMEFKYTLKSRWKGYYIELRGRPTQVPSQDFYWVHALHREWPNEDGIYEPPSTAECDSLRLVTLLRDNADLNDIDNKRIFKYILNDPDDLYSQDEESEI